MPEPMELTQRRIRFDRTPAQVAVTVDNVPVLVRNETALRTDPASITVFKQAGIGKDDRVGLVGAQRFNDLGKVINVTAATGTIEPELNQVSIPGCKFGKFSPVISV